MSGVTFDCDASTSIGTDIYQETAQNTHGVLIRDCVFLLGGTGTSAINMLATPTNTSGTEIIGCTFVAPASYADTVIKNARGAISGCTFVGTTTGSTSYFIQPEGDTTVTGCRFYCTAAASYTAFDLTSLAAATTYFTESANFFESDLSAAYALNNTYNDQLALGSRDNRWYDVTSDAASVTIKADQYGSVMLQRTAAGAQTVNLTPGPVGARFIFSLWNNGTGGAVTLTEGTGVSVVGASFTAVADNSIASWLFVSRIGNAGTPVWYMVNTPVDATE
jgi:hypothetical protein